MSSRKSIDALDDAVQSTRELLLPFDKGTWLRLMVLVVFTGGGMSFTGFPPVPTGNTGDYSGTDYGPADSTAANVSELGQVTGAATSAETGLAILGIVLFTGIVTFLLWLSSTFQFVYYQSLVDEEVSIRNNTRKHAWNGVSYMIFRSVVTLFMAVLAVAAFAGFAVSFPAGVLSLLIVAPLLVLVAVFSGLINNLTIPEMIKNDLGLLKAIKRTFGTVRSEWREVGIYVLVRFLVGLAIATGVFTVVMMLVFGFLMTFGILAVLLSSASPILGGMAAFTGILVFAVVVLVVRVPVKTFMYFYALRFYERL